MSALAELKKIAEELGLSSGAVSFEKKAPETYLVFTPLYDDLLLYADNRPLVETEEVRISLFSKENYLLWKRRLTDILLEQDFIITERRFLELEEDTGYYHYSLDVAKEYVR
jgi:hypothetical protein